MGGSFGSVNGMHFHIDRTFFGDEESRAKAAVLIDYMIFKYYDFFAGISHRKEGHFGYASKKEGVNGIMTAAARCAYTEHSYAVNGSNSATIEIRIFGGKINTGAKFLAVADIIQAVARWAKYTSFTAASRQTPTALIKYIKDPARVLDFVKNVNADRRQTTNGETMRVLFMEELKKAIRGE
jgi:hypothetical protein